MFYPDGLQRVPNLWGFFRSYTLSALPGWALDSHGESDGSRQLRLADTTHPNEAETGSAVLKWKPAFHSAVLWFGLEAAEPLQSIDAMWTAVIAAKTNGEKI